MASKPTSLAAQLTKDDLAKKAAEAKEDAEVSSKVAAKGKVWVRLVRPHYASDGTVHMPGITQLDADAVPKSAKVLTPKQVEAEEE